MKTTQLALQPWFTLNKTAILLAAGLLFAPTAQADPITQAHATVHADQPGPVINRNIYGQFVEHLGRGVYEGIWVGENSPIPNTRGIRNDVVAALKELNVPVIRWPGGCFADNYHWRDGVGPRDKRPKAINSNWGNVAETNAFGTDEFMDFLDQIGAKAYLSVNVGSGTPEEQESWLQYMTAPADQGLGLERAANGHPKPWSVPYIGVGNESWGCGGNMLADHYADQFRLFASYLKTYAKDRPALIASGADTDDYEWTDTVMARAMKWRLRPTPLMYNVTTPLTSGVSLHFYTFAGNDWDNKGRAIDFGEDKWAATLQRAELMDELITKHSAIMDKYDPDKKVALVVDEWGTWFKEEPLASSLYQQNTLRDAMVAGVTLNVFHHHADRVRMANIAQMINVLQAMVLTDKDRMVLTPTYYVFKMYKVHQDATALPVDVDSPTYTFGSTSLPALSVSASRDAAGKVHISIVNIDPHHQLPLALGLSGIRAKVVTGEILTGPAMDTYNSFDAPHRIHPALFDGAVLKNDQLILTVPSKSVITLELN